MSELEKIDKLHHLSEYTIEKLITEVSLYQKILISTIDITYLVGAYNYLGKVFVSNDIKKLHEICQSKQHIVLPCPTCNDDRPFEQSEAWNPRDVYENREENGEVRYNPVSVDCREQIVNGQDYSGNNLSEDGFSQRPEYLFGLDQLLNINKTYYNEGRWNEYVQLCANVCMSGILNSIFEFRKDFTCLKDDNHKGFADFLIVPAVTEELEPMDNSEDKEESENLYYKYKNALFLIKVGQYPSLRDLQLFDTKKYAKILGKQYTDYTLALGLYANGIGAGSFVYLRRILEQIVENIHKKCMDGEFDEDSYKDMKFNDKVKFLEDKYDKKIIPPELTDIKSKVYVMLSRGVHEFTDQECLEWFPIAKYIIDSILNERIHQKEKEKQLSEIKKQMNEL